MPTTSPTDPQAAVRPEHTTRSPADQAMGSQPAVRVAAVLKALGDPLRLRMLSLIAADPAAEACVDDLASVAPVSLPTVSHHLKVLKDVGLLTAERRGTRVYYRIAEDHRAAVSALLDTFAPIAAQAVTGTPLPGLADVDAALDRLAADLAAEHPFLDGALVTSVVRESYTALARTASVLTHLVVNAERFARQRLADLDRPGADARPRVLFVCVANAGRSQLAAALTASYARDRVVVRSAGSNPAGQVHPVVRPLLDELDPDHRAFPKPLTDDAVRAADVVVTMGCGDTCPVLPGTRYEDWAVADPSLASDEGARIVRDQIDHRVRVLLSDLLPDLDLPTT